MVLTQDEKRICKLADEKQFPYLHREELIRVIEIYRLKKGEIL